MIYGYIVHTKKNEKFSLYASVILSLISIILAVLFFKNYLTNIEIVSSLSFIWGGYYLANKKASTGWMLFIIAHITTSFAGFNKGQIIFSILQLASAIVCMYGLTISFKNAND